MVWQLAEAKNKFSEVFTKTIEEGPQFVTRRNEEIVLLSKDEYQRLTGAKPGFLEVLMSGPSLEGLDLTRDKSPMRDIEW
ncbi:MAG: type II toxin-antitoxin system Phd/YefM family antitoxin [Thermomicrobiales bacterium]